MNRKVKQVVFIVFNSDNIIYFMLFRRPLNFRNIHTFTLLGYNRAKSLATFAAIKKIKD